MCGIAGYTHRKGVGDAERIRDAAFSLAHRGPDQQGVHESARISLGAVRLRIIDLLSGEQPLSSEDGNAVLVFNGEIYNYAELRAELEADGHRFSTSSDTEVVLQAFLRWDTHCFRRFRGMFAIAVWLEREKRLVLARDRLGIKPLYIHRRGDEIYFGSELKAILAHPEVSRSLDLTSLHHYLAMGYVPGPRSLIAGIEKLPPGHVLDWRDGRVQLEPFWQLRLQPQNYPSIEAAQEQLDFLLGQSVREHLISDVPLGVWLSGGIDSSTILHYAQKAGLARAKTFSILFPGRSFDETRYIRQVAQRYATEHYELDLLPSADLPSAISDLVFYSDEPIADAGAVPVWFLSKLSRQHVTVALSGEGADELFGGYVTYRADRLAVVARRIPPLLRRGLLFLSRYWPVSDDKISFEYMLKRFLEGTFLPADEAHTYWNGAFSAAQQRDLLLASNGAGIRDLFDGRLPSCGSSEFLNRYLAFDQRYYLCDDILHKVDRMSMAHSLEVRPPFLDHRIVEFAASLPENWKIDGARQKVILKMLMAGKLPSRILRRSKTGLDIPVHEWLRGPLRPLLLDTLRAEAVRETNLFWPRRVEAVVQQHLNRQANLGYHLWGLLILFLWMKEWKIQAAPEAHQWGKTLETITAMA